LLKIYLGIHSFTKTLFSQTIGIISATIHRTANSCNSFFARLGFHSGQETKGNFIFKASITFKATKDQLIGLNGYCESFL